jgi:hypothetical protein
MDEDDRFASVELFSDGTEGRVTQVVVAVAVAGEKGYTVCFQDIESVGDFCEADFCGEEGWEGGKEAESLGIF